MSRSYASAAIIALPPLDASTAAALGRELLTNAEVVTDPPASFVRALKRLTESHRALQAALTSRLGHEESAPEVQREADRTIDSAWAAMNAALEGWARLPGLVETTKQQAARELLELLFPDGMKFLQVAFKTEWAESNTRLERIDASGIAPRLRSLIGDEFLATVRVAHDAYGKALGITTRSTAPLESAVVSLREPLATFLTALRDYVLKTSALAEPGDAASEALVSELLSPILTWEPRRKARGGEDESPATTDGSAPAVPDADK